MGGISIRYARALFEYASEKKCEDVVFSEMKKLLACFTGNSSLQETLNSPILLNSDKQKLIIDAVGGKASDAFVRFIELVLDRRRGDILHSICLGYLDLYREHNNIFEGKLVTATPLDQGTESKIKQLVSTKVNGTLDFETVVDPSIEGGFVLFIDTYRFDASVSSQLNKIRKDLLGKNKKVV